MPYIDYDTNGNITGQFACQQYENQLQVNEVIEQKDLDKYLVIDGVLTDITNTSEYIAEQKAKLIQSEETKKAAIFSKVADSILTDDLQLKVGKITQAVHDSRLTAKLAIYQQAEDNFYTNTGLERPTIIGA